MDVLFLPGSASGYSRVPAVTLLAEDRAAFVAISGDQPIAHGDSLDSVEGELQPAQSTAAQ